MPWRDIHLNGNIAHMLASCGTAHIELLTNPVNLTGCGSEVTVAQVNNSIFYPSIAETCYACTRDSYYPTSVKVFTDGNVKVVYSGGPTGNRIVSHILTYNIG